MSPSSLHWKVEPVLELEKLKLAVVWLVGFAGCELIVTVGAVVSIVHVALALPVLPAGSVAVTVKVWEPAARPPAYGVGVVRGVAEAPPWLRRNGQAGGRVVVLKV